MHILGMLGMPRRVYTYAAVSGWGTTNLVETVGAFVLALGVLVFLVNVVWSKRRGKQAGDNPWDGGTLEWATPSPPPPYNFAVIPIVGSRHPLWEDRLDEGTGRSSLERGLVLADGRETVGTSALDAEPSTIMRMPEDSAWPLVLAVSLTIVCYGLLAESIWLFTLGVFGTAMSAIGWLWPERLHDEAPIDTPFGELPVGGIGSRTVGWWGMTCTIATEAAFFAYLLFSYFYLGSMASVWPPREPPELTLALPNTVVLLASSAALWWGESGIRHGSRGRLRLGLAITILLGVAFLVVQVVEYSRQTVGPGTNAYGSLFFTITGFHGAHVAVGLLMLLYVLARALRGDFGDDRHEAVSNVALYWHFVDAVWLAVFTSLYLSPRFV
jgi:cytochrome c oxidase subunit I+III